MKTVPGQLNLWDGEKKDVYVVVPTNQKRQKDFVIFNQKGGRMIMLDKDLTALDHRVFWAYICEADYELYVWTSQAEIARNLDIPPQRVNEAVKRLVAKKLLHEEAQVGRRKVYKLTSAVFRKGWENKRYREAAAEDTRQLRLIS